MKTVVSHCQLRDDVTYESKVDQIRRMKGAYFVVVISVGIASVGLSIGRVKTRAQENSHAVPQRSAKARSSWL